MQLKAQKWKCFVYGVKLIMVFDCILKLDIFCCDLCNIDLGKLIRNEHVNDIRPIITSCVNWHLIHLDVVLHGKCPCDPVFFYHVLKQTFPVKAAVKVEI